MSEEYFKLREKMTERDKEISNWLFSLLDDIDAELESLTLLKDKAATFLEKIHNEYNIKVRLD